MTKEFKPKGTYQSLTFIGRGAVGEVYRAEGKDGRSVAIKNQNGVIRSCSPLPARPTCWFTGEESNLVNLLKSVWMI